jgi:hypothetical protein
MARYFVMKHNNAYVSGWGLVGQATDVPTAEAIQEAHTARMQNGKIHNRPQVWDERKFYEWQKKQRS